MKLQSVPDCYFLTFLILDWDPDRPCQFMMES